MLSITPLSYAKASPTVFMKATISAALRAVPGRLRQMPVYLCIDDTMVEKAGKRFEHVSKLFDHAAHNGTNYLNGHCFVSIMLCVPVWDGKKVSYPGVPLNYQMWDKSMTKLQMACAMIQDAMESLSGLSRVIILCDSWYAKADVFALTQSFDNLDLICNVRKDTALYGLPPAPSGKRGRPRKKGAKLDVEKDFTFTVKKLDGWHVGHRTVLTNLLNGSR